MLCLRVPLGHQTFPRRCRSPFIYSCCVCHRRSGGDERGGGGRGLSLLSVSVRVEEVFVQSGQLWLCDSARGRDGGGKGEGHGGGGVRGWRRRAVLTGCHTCFQQHYLIILTQLHEAVDALGELHHILNGLRYFDGAQLPHDFPGLRARERTEGEKGWWALSRAFRRPMGAWLAAAVGDSPCSGSSPPPPAGRPARSSAAAPPSGTDMSPCVTWRCSEPGALQRNQKEARERQATSRAGRVTYWKWNNSHKISGTLPK